MMVERSREEEIMIDALTILFKVDRNKWSMQNSSEYYLQIISRYRKVNFLPSNFCPVEFAVSYSPLNWYLDYLYAIVARRTTLFQPAITQPSEKLTCLGTLGVRMNRLKAARTVLVARMHRRAPTYPHIFSACWTRPIPIPSQLLLRSNTPPAHHSIITWLYSIISLAAVCSIYVGSSPYPYRS
jgi:hypothetical protein